MISIVVFALSGIVTWIVVVRWMHSGKLKGNTSTENLARLTSC